MVEYASSYTFGDSAVAGDRLALLATVFGPTSEELLGIAAPHRPEVAVDLGCGPGHTTALVARVSGATRTIGLDRSTAFVDRARREAPAGIEFVEHDVLRTPFPCPPADLVFARYLLAHLPEPLRVASRWATQLGLGGRLVVEEVEDIQTSRPPFARYLEIAVALVAAHGADMYAGCVLRDGHVTGVRTSMSRTARIRPSTDIVARIFGMNLATWRNDPWVTDNVDPSEITQLAAEIEELTSRQASDEIVWTHRQVVYERD